jgi:uncharacterized protein YdeI (YjbR/CyaY-like superfamily)
MIHTNPQVDAYIAKAEPFAQPILQHIRKLVHSAFPEIEEMIKWSFPHFVYKGTVCSMAAFKQHCAFGFRKAAIMQDPEGILETKDRGAMGHFNRITSLNDLPADKILITYIKEAVRLNEEGIKLPSKPKPKVKKELPIPAELAAALKKNKKAATAFAQFSISHKWITEAKTELTQNKRTATTIEWLTEGKQRHWKYHGK